MKIIMLFALFLVGCSQLYAQKIRIDSVAIKRKLAYADARQFKPTKEIRLAKRKRHLLNTSDYFMPTVANVSNPEFLTDSVYVQAYKDAAYRRSVNGSIGHIHYAPDLSAGHIIKVVVAGTAAIVLAVLFVKVIINGAAGK